MQQENELMKEQLDQALSDKNYHKMTKLKMVDDETQVYNLFSFKKMNALFC